MEDQTARKPSTSVTTNSKGGWKVTKGGKQISNHKTQKTAISKGQSVAKNVKGELRIHGTDGKIRDTRSYGNDPNPPKDRDHKVTLIGEFNSPVIY